MLKKLCLSLILLLLSFIFPRETFAALYINEFSSGTTSDWVEIYNSDNNPVDLSNYMLREGKSTNVIDLVGSIVGSGFKAFDWSDKLDNDGDTIQLLLKADESKVDQVIYGNSADVTVPLGNQTAGRNPDGTSSWTLLSVASKESSNNLPTPTSTPTFSPTNTPVPTSTPTVTPLPTNTPAPKNTPTPTIKVILTPTPKLSLSPTTSLSPTQNPSPTKEVLGDKTKVLSPTAVEKPIGSDANKFPIGIIVVSICSIFLLGCGILGFLKYEDGKKSE